MKKVLISAIALFSIITGIGIYEYTQMLQFTYSFGNYVLQNGNLNFTLSLSNPGIFKIGLGACEVDIYEGNNKIGTVAVNATEIPAGNIGIINLSLLNVDSIISIANIANLQNGLTFKGVLPLQYAKITLYKYTLNYTMTLQDIESLL